MLQNREPAGSSAPQAVQVAPRRAPQPRQKFDWGGLSCRHREQVIVDLRAALEQYRDAVEVEIYRSLTD